MKAVKTIAGTLAIAFMLSGCGSPVSSAAPESIPVQSVLASTASEAVDTKDATNDLLPRNEIPASYLEPSSQPGQVVRLDYETNTYDETNREMNKYAYVYLPYGYDPQDEQTRYDILYLMHGWTGDAELYLDGENGTRPLKYILDNLIANGDMEPMIVVTPTYYQDNQEKGPSVEQEDAGLTANFYHELLADLMPTVESTYHTYARSGEDADLQASRDHRIFGGFSMGAVTTWYTFLHGLDYFKYFMPISGDCWVISETGMGTDQQTAEETASYLSQYIQESGYTPDDFEIYALTGSNDTAEPALSRQIEAMKKHPESFRYSDTASDGNLHYQITEGGVHSYTSMIRYIYNVLPVLATKMGQ